MATVAKKPAVQAPDNLAIWNALCKTDPAHTKGFKRAGGFTGTAIKPIWIIRRLTEQFGPCGIGWGMEKPTYELVPGENRELLVFCTVEGWYIENGTRATVYGVGGDKVVTHIKANEQYKRPERWDSDDEAFKKAFTDAVNNAFKFVGVGADVHMGQFDDSKYVQAVQQEFAANDGNGKPAANGKSDAPFPQGPAKNKTELKDLGRTFWKDVEACGDDDELSALLASNVALVNQLRAALPMWWEGGHPDGGEPFKGLGEVITDMQAAFANEAWTRNPVSAG